jgi:hypothetical protein
LLLVPFLQAFGELHMPIKYAIFDNLKAYTKILRQKMRRHSTLEGTIRLCCRALELA